MRRNGYSSRCIAVGIVVALAVLPAIAGGTWVKTRIGLHTKDSGDPLASGKAIYREKDFGLRRTLRVEMNNISSSTNVNVYVGTDLVGNVSLVLGAGTLFIDTAENDDVPVIGFGSVVKVKDSSDAHVILRGKNH